MREDIMQVDTVTLDDEKNALVIIDQTLLPGEVRMLSLTRQEDIREAIYMLRAGHRRGGCDRHVSGRAENRSADLR